MEQKAAGVSRRCIAFRMGENTPPPRPGYPIYVVGCDRCVGMVVSGTQSPSLGIGIGMAYLPSEFARPGTQLKIEIRGKAAPAEVVSKPIYRKPV
jgi:aminomethyltransferase